MITQTDFPHPISDILLDSFVGSLCFKWDNAFFNNIMEFLGFQRVNNRAHQEIYKKRVNDCSLAAYPNGKITFNGCHSQDEMKEINRQLKRKLSNFYQSKIVNIEKLKIISFRCKIQYNFILDIEKLSTYLFGLESYNRNMREKVDFIPEHSKIMIPQWIHKVKNLRLFATRLGYIEIYRANLIQNLQKFGIQIYQNILKNFSSSPQKIQIFMYNKHEHWNKRPMVKKILIKNNEEYEQNQQQQNKKHQFRENNIEKKNQFIRYQFESDLDQIQRPPEVNQNQGNKQKPKSSFLNKSLYSNKTQMKQPLI